MVETPSRRQITKRCHWVPQAYLRYFAADAAREKIWRFSKRDEGGDPDLKPIDKVAVRFYLYSPKDAGSDTRNDRMERKLSDLEGFFGNPQWAELCTGMVDLSFTPYRQMISLIVAVMQLRNPVYFDVHKSFHRQIVDSVAINGSLPSAFEHNGRSYTFDPASWPAFRDATEDDLHREWLDDLDCAGWYAKELMEMRWSIVVADKPTFVTSDNPVGLNHPSLEFRGLSDPKTFLTFPLSPTHLLHMDHLHHEPANRYYPLKDSGAAQNLMVWRTAIDHMFTSRHPDEVMLDFLRDEQAIRHAGEVGAPHKRKTPDGPDASSR